MSLYITTYTLNIICISGKLNGSQLFYYVELVYTILIVYSDRHYKKIKNKTVSKLVRNKYGFLFKKKWNLISNFRYYLLQSYKLDVFIIRIHHILAAILFIFIFLSMAGVILKMILCQFVDHCLLVISLFCTISLKIYF